MVQDALLLCQAEAADLQRRSTQEARLARVGTSSQPRNSSAQARRLHTSLAAACNPRCRRGSKISSVLVLGLDVIFLARLTSRGLSATSSVGRVTVTSGAIPS